MNRSRASCVANPVPRAAGLAAFLLLSSLTTLSVSVVGPARAEAQIVDAETLLARMARIEGLHCSYREEKRIALLSAPVITEGTVDYARPGRMARRTTRPGRQVVLIDGGELRMSDGRSTQRIDLTSQPVVRSFVDSFLLLLAGDRDALRRLYDLTFRISVREGRSTWSLELRPRSAPLSQFLRTIVFEGSGESLERMVMTEVSGDTTTTTFSDVDAARRYSASEASTVFSLTP